MRERIVRVICNFKYLRVRSFTLRGGWLEKTTIFPESFCGRRAQKHQGKKIQAKLLVTKNNK